MGLPLRVRAERAIVSFFRASGKGRDGWLRLLFDAQPLSADLLLRGYQLGMFPFPDSDEMLRWRLPEERAVVVLNKLRFGRHLVRDIRRKDFEVTFNQDFEGVVRGCAQKTESRPETWITEELIDCYLELHRLGCAHSAEARQDGKVVGGAFGVGVGGYFCADSLFFRVPGASKVALAYLAEALRRQRFELLDLQYPKPFSERFGAVTMDPEQFGKALLEAQCARVTFEPPEPFTFDPKAVMRELGTK